MIVLALTALLSQDAPAEGWTEVRFHRVHLRNGNFVDGHLLRNEPEAVTLRVKTGELEIARELVLKVEHVRIRSYADKAIVVPPPPPVPAADEPPVVAAAAPAPGPVRLRVEELFARARSMPSERRETVLRELAALGYDGALTIVSLAEKLNDDDLRFAGRVLREVRLPAMKDPVLGLLRSTSPLVRAEAVAVLASMGVETDCLRDGSPAVRAAALEAAAVFKSRTAFERAAAMCADPNPELRRQAVRTSFLLAREHQLGPALAEALAAALSGDATVAARVEILDALGRLRNAAVWPAVAEELRRDATEVRVAAARCLGELRMPDAASAMAEAVDEETVSEVKVALAEAAGKLRDGALVEPLIQRLSDPDPKVVRACADALTQITGQNLGVSKTRWEEYWKKVQGR